MSSWASAQQPLVAPSPPILGDGVAADELADDGPDVAGRPRRAVPQPPPPDRHGPARVGAILNQKGRAGKDTSANNHRAAPAGDGRRGLLVRARPPGPA